MMMDPTLLAFLVDDILHSLGPSVSGSVPRPLVEQLLEVFAYQTDTVRAELLLMMQPREVVTIPPAHAVRLDTSGHDRVFVPEQVPLAGTPVEMWLYVYDLAPKSFTGNMSRSLGMGIYHSALVVFGREWSFGGTQEAIPAGQPVPSGIFQCLPGEGAEHFYEKIKLGEKPMLWKDFTALINKLAPDWPITSYHLLKRNCNHFVEALCHEIDPSFKVPPYINRAARAGSVVVPEALLKKVTGTAEIAPPEAPVNRGLTDVSQRRPGTAPPKSRTTLKKAK